MQLQVEVPCPIKTLEGVTVTYDMMADNTKLLAFQRSLGLEHDGVVADVTGWPEEYGDDPFGDKSPIAFRAWSIKGGFAEALRLFTTDPNYLMA